METDQNSAPKAEEVHLPLAPLVPSPEPSAVKELLIKMVGRACAHLSNGFRLTCCAAPKYSDGGPDELRSARTLMYEISHLLNASNLAPSDDPPEEFVSLQAEVMAWREKFSELEYRRRDDCIAPKTWPMKR